MCTLKKRAASLPWVRVLLPAAAAQRLAVQEPRCGQPVPAAAGGEVQVLLQLAHTG